MQIILKLFLKIDKKDRDMQFCVPNLLFKTLVKLQQGLYVTLTNQSLDHF
jgi:hypothetical protein